jgi:Xaa-Pro aminopeptidase
MIRGFETSEYKSRVDRAQRMMAEDGIDALLLTTEQNVRYFTGYLTRFWESPSRPWFLIVPQSGKPVAVIPSIGAALMGKTWISDIRTWSAPDLVNDGVTLLADTLAEIVGQTARIGIPSGYETHLRMPLSALAAMQILCTACAW